ncbi:MFS transporter [uncultured Selenomonas sp.]|uniref:MFS transporter n=1 Tax=uncultured Selenomonas sp. TaxID=159275 RepID=UPI0028E2D192|nr:MFS transporter [uncultured Selenomonas sp.]
MNTNIRHATALLSTGHAMVDFYANFLPILLPLLMLKFDLSLTMCGVLVMVASVTTNMLQPFFGYLMDKQNFSPLLPYIVPAAAVPMCMVGFAGNTMLLFVFVAVTGTAVAAYHPLSSILVGRTAAEGRGNGMMSYFIAGGNAGMAFVPLVLVAFLEQLSLAALLLLILPAALMGLLFVRSGLCAVSSLPEHAVQSRPKLSSVLFARTTITLNLAMGLRCWTHGAFGTFLPLLLVGNGEDTSAAGLFLTIFMVGGMMGGLFGGNLADKFTGRGIIVTFLALGILPCAYYFTHVSADTLGGIVLFAAGFALMAPQPSSIIWAQQALPENAAMASGMMLGMSFGLGSLGVAATAALGDFIGLEPALLISVLALPLATLLAYMTPEPQKK